MSREWEIRLFMMKKLAYISKMSDQGEGKAYLSNLRKGIGHVPGEIPELMGILLTDMPEEFMSKSSTATKEEWACYIALTLFAMHQQGNDMNSHPMHTDKRMSIGTAMRDYVMQANDSNARERMAVKLQALGTSKDMNELSYHLKSIIHLLKSSGIPLNYAELAGDIYDYQFPERQPDVRLKWGQDFYRNVKLENKAKEESNNE